MTKADEQGLVGFVDTKQYRRQPVYILKVPHALKARKAWYAGDVFQTSTGTEVSKDSTVGEIVFADHESRWIVVKAAGEPVWKNDTHKPWMGKFIGTHGARMTIRETVRRVPKAGDNRPAHRVNKIKVTS
jgi:hypothetical protein